MSACDCLRIDAREAVSSLDRPSRARDFFFLDLRRSAEGQGVLPSGLAAEGPAWRSPVLVEGVVGCLRALKPTVASLFPPHPERDRRRRQRAPRGSRLRPGVSAGLSGVGFDGGVERSVLARSAVCRVAVVDGGFAAIHEFLRAKDRMEWLVDHSERSCAVCSAFRLQHTVQRVRENVASTAQSVAGRAVLAFQKVQESIRNGELPRETSLRKVQETAQAGLGKLGETGQSLLSKAWSWTKERGSELAKRGEAKGREWTIVAAEEEDVKNDVEKDVFTVESEEEEDVLFDRKFRDRSLIALANDMKKGQRFEADVFANAGGLVYDVEKLETSDDMNREGQAEENDGGEKVFHVMIFGSRVLVYFQEDSGHSVVKYNLDGLNIKKMTLKKDDKSVITLYFVGETDSVFFLRLKLANASDFLEDVQIMIEDNAN